MARLEQRLALVAHENRKLQAMNAKLQDKIHQLTEAQRCTHGSMEGLPLKKRVSAEVDLQKEVIDHLRGSYEESIRKVLDDKQNLVATLDTILHLISDKLVEMVPGM